VTTPITAMNRPADLPALPRGLPMVRPPDAQRLARERELLAELDTSGPLTRAWGFVKLSGPGYMQSALTLGAGTASATLFSGAVFGYKLLWVAPLAMLLGVIVFAAIAHQTLSTGLRPLQAMRVHAGPFFAYGWAVASLLSSIIWHFPQYAMAGAVAADLVGRAQVAHVDEGDLVFVEVDTVRKERACVQRPGGGETRHNSDPVEGNGVALVDCVLGGMDVQADRELARRRCAGRECLVGEREGRVRTDQPSHQRRLLTEHALDEPTILRNACLRALRPVAVRRLVAEHGANAERAQRVLDDVERPFDRVRRGVVVHERGRARKECLHPAHQSRCAHALLVERAIEPPPDALQDLEEVLGGREIVGHTARKRRVQVGVRADVAGDDEAARAVATLGAAVCGDSPVRHVHVVSGDLHRIERADDGSAREDHVRPPARTR